jgi:hypothetical protein
MIDAESEVDKIQTRTMLRILSPTSFEVYAIRHTLTGKYLPMHWTRGEYGNTYSHDEPQHTFPRLFKSHRSAQAALTAWLAGTWFTDIEHEYSDGYRIGSYKTEPQVKTSGADLGRVKEDMEIVRFVLTLAPESIAP